MIRVSLICLWMLLCLTAELCAKPAEAAWLPGYDVPMTVTAYCLLGKTYSGIGVHTGAIAAHASVPLYTRYYIPGYGLGTVLDRGKLVTEQLDIWMSDCWYALNVWGRRRIMVVRFTP